MLDLLTMDTNALTKILVRTQIMCIKVLTTPIHFKLTSNVNTTMIMIFVINKRNFWRHCAILWTVLLKFVIHFKSWINYCDPTPPNLIIKRKLKRNILWFNPIYIYIYLFIYIYYIYIYIYIYLYIYIYAAESGFNDILSWNISQMIRKTIQISRE